MRVNFKFFHKIIAIIYSYYLCVKLSILMLIFLHSFNQCEGIVSCVRYIVLLCYKSLLPNYDFVYGCVSLLIIVVVIYFIILVIILVLLSLGIEYCCIFVRNRTLPDVELLQIVIFCYSCCKLY